MCVKDTYTESKLLGMNWLELIIYMNACICNVNCGEE